MSNLKLSNYFVIILLFLSSVAFAGDKRFFTEKSHEIEYIYVFSYDCFRCQEVADYIALWQTKQHHKIRYIPVASTKKQQTSARFYYLLKTISSDLGLRTNEKIGYVVLNENLINFKDVMSYKIVFETIFGVEFTDEKFNQYWGDATVYMKVGKNILKQLKPQNHTIPFMRVSSDINEKYIHLNTNSSNLGLDFLRRINKNVELIR